MESQNGPEEIQVDIEATTENALEFVDKMTAERRGEEYVAPPTEEELIKLSFEKAVKLEPEKVTAQAGPIEETSVDATEEDTESNVPESVQETDDNPSFVEKIRRNTVLRAAGAAIALGVPAVTAAGCAPSYDQEIAAQKIDQRDIEKFMTLYAPEWSGGQEVPGLSVVLVKAHIPSGETTASIVGGNNSYTAAGEYHIVIPEGYSMQRFGLDAKNGQVLLDVWHGPMDESYSFHMSERTPLVIYKDGNPNPVGTFTVAGY